MEPVAYMQWAVMPVDPDPASGEPTVLRTPMMTTVALDRGASLVFHFAAAPGAVTVAVEVTALTGEGRPTDLLAAYTGTTSTAFAALPTPSWDLSHEGMFAVFRSQLSGVGDWLKLVLTDDRPLIVNKVEILR